MRTPEGLERYLQAFFLGSGVKVLLRPSPAQANSGPRAGQTSPSKRRQGAAAITLDGKANTGPGATPRHRM